MARDPIWHKSDFKGVRYRKHKTRRHGVQMDRYYVLTYKCDGRTITEGVGWASDGVRPGECYELWKDLKKNRQVGEGPRTLAEKRALDDALRQAEAEAEDQAQRERITIAAFFTDTYMPAQEAAGKKYDSLRRERELFKLFIEPQIGTKTFGEASPFDCEAIKARMLKTDRSPRTVEYALAVVRQIFNAARFHGIHNLESPTRRVKKPRFDNRRVRFLTEAEAAALLAKLKEKSLRVYRQAVLSLYAGVRFGEVATLAWGDVDLERGVLTLRDTKSGRTRPAFITQKIRTEVFERMEPGRPDDLVFPAARHRKRHTVRVGPEFRQAVEELKLNEGISDRRQRVCFHSLRHTYASWLVQRGTSLYEVMRLLGHSTITLTERYAHLAPDALQAATRVLDQVGAEQQGAEIVKHPAAK